VAEPPVLGGIEPLGRHHDRAAFACGDEDLDRYLHRQARQEHSRDIARVFVATGREPQIIAGYYTLSSFTIEFGNLPTELARKLPHYPHVPAALIGRFAVALECQGQGIGGLLLVDALYRIVDASQSVASYAIVVHAKDAGAAAFYEKHGFIPFPDHPKHLFLPVATVRKLFL
jgi:GNAT superfamily N-acetyltransferase